MKQLKLIGILILFLVIIGIDGDGQSGCSSKRAIRQNGRIMTEVFQMVSFVFEPEELVNGSNVFPEDSIVLSGNKASRRCLLALKILKQQIEKLKKKLLKLKLK